MASSGQPLTGGQKRTRKFNTQDGEGIELETESETEQRVRDREDELSAKKGDVLEKKGESSASKRKEDRPRGTERGPRERVAQSEIKTSREHAELKKQKREETEYERGTKTEDVRPPVSVPRATTHHRHHPPRFSDHPRASPSAAAAVSRPEQFLVLDEADRVLDVGFEEELRVIFQCLPRKRQTLLFSATITSDLQTLLKLSSNKAFFYEAYEGFKTVDTLKQQYIFIPKNVKDVYLFHVLSKLEDMGIRSVMIFVSTCRSCHLLSLLLEELDQEAAALHSLKSQNLRLAALHRFKSGQVPILLATDVASRGLDIPTVDLVINYDIPQFPRDYVHRVGRAARAGRGGLAISFVTQDDITLIQEIEADLGRQLEKFDCKENEVLSDITKVYKARRVATMKMTDDGFEEKVKERKKQKRKTMAQKGLLNKRSNKRKRRLNTS